RHWFSARIGSEETYRREHAVQGCDGGFDAFIAQVSFDIDGEEVFAQVFAGGARVDEPEADDEGGQLVDDLLQRAGLVVGQRHDHRGFIGAGTFWQAAGAGDDDKAGDRAQGVFDTFGQHGYLKAACQMRGAYGGVIVGGIVQQPAGPGRS